MTGRAGVLPPGALPLAVVLPARGPRVLRPGRAGVGPDHRRARPGREGGGRRRDRLRLRAAGGGGLPQPSGRARPPRPRARPPPPKDPPPRSALLPQNLLPAPRPPAPP